MPDYLDQAFDSFGAAPAGKAPAAPTPKSDYLDQAFDQVHAQMQTDPAAHPAMMTTPEMAARQQMAQENAQRGGAGSALAGALQNYAGVAGRFQKMLAGPVGLIAPQAAENMRIAAERTEDFAPSEDHPFAGAAGNIAGGMPAAFTGPVGVALNTANAGEQAYHNVEQLRDQGQQISGGRAAADVTLQALLAGGLTKLGQKNITGPLAPAIAKTLISEGRPAASAITRLLARGAIGAGLQGGGTAAGNAITQQTVNPQQSVGEGVGKAAMIGAGIEAGGGALHELLARGQGGGRTKPAPQPAADPGTQPAEQTLEKQETHVPPDRPVPATAEGQPARAAAEQQILTANAESDRLKAANDPAADHQAAQVQKLLADYEQAHGEDAAEGLIARMKEAAKDARADQLIETPPPVKEADMARIGAEMVENERRNAEEDRRRKQEDITFAERRQAEQRRSRPATVDDLMAAPPMNAIEQMKARRAADQNVRTSEQVQTERDEKLRVAHGLLERLRKIHDDMVYPAPNEPGYLASIKGRDRLVAREIKRTETEWRKNHPESSNNGQPTTDNGQPALPAGMRRGTVAVPDALNQLVKRDVAPAVFRTTSNAQASFEAVNRFIGSGLNLNEKTRDTAISLRENEANHEVNQARMETEIKPYREVLEKLSDQERTRWVDETEGHGRTGIPQLWGLELQNKKWNAENKAEGKEYGLDTDKWKADWVGRLAQFPAGQEAGPGGKTRGSIAGSQKFRLKRDYDTFSAFKSAVENAGGTLKYENPADMLLAKQMEVRRSIEARKLMYEQEKAGQLKWIPDSEKAADEQQHDTKLIDPLARQARDVVAPKWMVAKLLNLPHAEAEQYLKSPQWQNKSQMLRPGDEMPEGFAKSGEKVQGQYHADANAAGLFNNLISKGFEKDVPILSQIADLRRRVTALNLAVPTAHAALTTVSNAVTRFSLATEAAFKGHWDLAAKNAYAAINPARAAREGTQIREQAADPQAHPELENVVQTSMKGGNKFDLKSVLNETAYQKAKKEWEAGNTAGAAGRGIQAVYHAIEAPLFDHYIPSIKAAYKGAAAEIAIRDGMTGKELSRKMALVQDNADNLLGMVKRAHQFQNRILTDLEDLTFTAPKFAEGTYRFAGATGRDTAKALAALGSGKKPTFTPAMYTAVAGVMTHMMGAALFQAAYTTATTGKPIWPTSLEDYFKPRTGRKDDAGRDERVSVLSPFSALFSAAEHGVGSVTGRIGGLWKAAKAEMTGVDEQGRKLEGAGGRLGYAGKQLLPYSIQNLMEQKKRGEVTPDKVAGSLLGMHYGHEGSTPAERAAWDVIHAHYQAQPMGAEEAAKSDLTRKLIHEQHTHDPNAARDNQAALREGKLSPQDLTAIRRRASEKPGLAGLLKSSEIDAKSMMSQVWPKMTADEKKQFRLVVRGKIGRSSLTQGQKEELWKQTDQR